MRARTARIPGFTHISVFDVVTALLLLSVCSFLLGPSTFCPSMFCLLCSMLLYFFHKRNTSLAIDSLITHRLSPQTHTTHKKSVTQNPYLGILACTHNISLHRCCRLLDIFFSLFSRLFFFFFASVFVSMLILFFPSHSDHDSYLREKRKFAPLSELLSFLLSVRGCFQLLDHLTDSWIMLLNPLSVMTQLSAHILFDIAQQPDTTTVHLILMPRG